MDENKTDREFFAEFFTQQRLNAMLEKILEDLHAQIVELGSENYSRCGGSCGCLKCRATDWLLLDVVKRRHYFLDIQEWANGWSSTKA
ncbi:unnamed protein product [marine sediment metagenome]|uniref:Uncharacterized protein n=1 Tax=marine sediment metagenome TaxID=412755 RepID=X0VGS4_9ZZZZ